MRSSSESNLQFFTQSGVKFTFKYRTRLKFLLGNLFKKEGKRNIHVSYVFCSDTYLLKLNQEFLQHDYYTDIITFNLSEGKEELVAEVYISVDRVRENARLFKSSFQSELHRVIFHGALHLCGFKDKTTPQKREMRNKENEYLSKL